MTLEIQVLVWDRYKKVSELNQFMVSKPFLLDIYNTGIASIVHTKLLQCIYLSILLNDVTILTIRDI